MLPLLFFTFFSHERGLILFLSAENQTNVTAVFNLFNLSFFFYNFICAIFKCINVQSIHYTFFFFFFFFFVYKFLIRVCILKTKCNVFQKKNNSNLKKNGRRRKKKKEKN